MLILYRKLGESIIIGNDIVLTVIDISRNKVKIGLKAPPEVLILRDELCTRVSKEKEEQQR